MNCCDCCPLTPLDRSQAKTAVIHWDTKIFTEITGSGSVDSIAVVISQQSESTLLGVPKKENSTGEEMAESVFRMLIEWDAMDDIEAMSFDTTYSNSGQYIGACVLLERKMRKHLLRLPCRHHIYEVLLRGVFDAKFGKTTSPNVALFNRFKNTWNTIDQTKYEPGIHDRFVYTNSNDVSGFVAQHWKKISLAMITRSY